MTSQLDFFATPVLPATTQVAKPQAVARRGQDVIGPDDEAMARHLEATGNYRILRKLWPRSVVEHTRSEFPRQGHRPKRDRRRDGCGPRKNFGVRLN